MHRFVRALGAVAVVSLMSTGLAVGVSTPSQAETPRATGQRADLPVLSGSGVVGQPLTVLVAGVATLLPVQWLRDGSPIPGVTGGTYVPTTDDVGHAISALVTVPIVGDIATSAITIVADPGSSGDVLSLLNDLVLTGGTQVGQLVGVTEPLWSQPGVSTGYQWLRDNAPIPGAVDPTYILSPDDAGHAIAAQVTGTLAGFPVVSQLTDTLNVPLADTPALAAVGDLAIADGSHKIGTQLTLSGPTWDQADATTEYQWLRDGSPISGATTDTYTLVAADFQHAIAVAATGHKDGYTDSTITSDPIDPVIGDAIRYTAKPRITGTGKVGKLLTADPGEWSGGSADAVPPVFTYQWLRDGARIDGAVAQTYQVEKADVGKAITVLVTATRPAYKSGTFTTSPVTVAKLASKLVAKAPRKVVKKGRAAVLKLVLKVAGVKSPTGRVKILDGHKKVQKAKFAPGKRGRLVVKIRKLKPGVHKLKAVYTGTGTIAGARSKVVRVKVRR